MLAVSLISLPPETLRRLADQSPSQGGGGERGERRVALAVAAAALFAALLAAAFAG